ncbi:protein SRC2-like [Bidens hawaiensis]|uniref:protein SRC2-like n=1 Tax=Bidens hawaiensis TaxID=980011 RepID=UPI0040497611
MEYRNLSLTLVSANDLKKSRFTGSMLVYAVVFITGGKEQKQRTSTDKHGDSNPTWNAPMKFAIDEEVSSLVVKIKAEGMFGGTNLGEVRVPVKELLEGFKGNGKEVQTASYQVRRPFGKSNGVLCFKYEFGEKFMAPRGMGMGMTSGYPPWEQQEAGYVYYPRRPRPVVPPRRCASMGFGFGTSSMGFGFGTGLVRGALVDRSVI